MLDKQCLWCKEIKPIKEFKKNSRNKDGHLTYCNQCYAKHVGPKRRLKNQSDWRQIRLQVLHHYCGEVLHCMCKGCYYHTHELDYRFLAIDHINGDGARHRKLLKKSGASFYKWLVRSNYPSMFQVLCHNCNFVKKTAHHCIHEDIIEEQRECVERLYLTKRKNGYYYVGWFVPGEGDRRKWKSTKLKDKQAAEIYRDQHFKLKG